MTCCSATSGNARNLRPGTAASSPWHPKQNGLTDAELKEAIIHLACYAGWPKAMSAITVAKEILAG